MTADQWIAALSAVAAVLGALLEVQRGRHQAEMSDIRERLRVAEVRIERLEARP